MIIQSTRVYFEEKLQPRQVVIEDGKIKDVLPYGLVEGAKDYCDMLIIIAFLWSPKMTELTKYHA